MAKKGQKALGPKVDALPCAPHKWVPAGVCKRRGRVGWVYWVIHLNEFKFTTKVLLKFRYVGSSITIFEQEEIADA